MLIIKPPLIFDGICRYCNTPTVKRKTPPDTAHPQNKHFFDYYQCPKCKTNYGDNKKETKQC